MEPKKTVAALGATAAISLAMGLAIGHDKPDGWQGGEFYRVGTKGAVHLRVLDVEAMPKMDGEVPAGSCFQTCIDEVLKNQPPPAAPPPSKKQGPNSPANPK